MGVVYMATVFCFLLLNDKGDLMGVVYVATVFCFLLLNDKGI